MRKRLPVFLPSLVLLLDLVDELPHQVQYAVPRPGLLPEVGRGVAALCGRNRRIAGAPELPLVEGQKVGLRPHQLGRHVDQFRVDGEVGQAPPIGEQRLPRVSVRPVLANGVLHGLARERVLELRREDGDPVQE